MPFNIGLGHLVIACEAATERHRVADTLQGQGASLENTSVKTDAALQKDYMPFKDPNPIAW